MYLSTLYKTLEVLFLRIEERKERQDGKVTASRKTFSSFQNKSF